ncbi:MAG: hypothetical protein JWM80_1354 [Cyanobacteria bacterium RYN_339]|nr:hypothetical protein [Cyanobacteria bacterium RYN_339]
MEIAPFAVGTLVATSLEAFLATAGLNLGEPLPDGRKLETPHSGEAWIALYAAAALLDQFEPTMARALHADYRARLERLVGRYEARYPGPHAPVPPESADLAAIAAAAWQELDAQT